METYRDEIPGPCLFFLWRNKHKSNVYRRTDSFSFSATFSLISMKHMETKLYFPLEALKI